MRCSIRSVLALFLGMSLVLPSQGWANTSLARNSNAQSSNSQEPLTLEQAGQALAQQYMHLSAGEKSGIARQLYAEAEAHVERLEWESAIQKYVAAYFLVPEKHGFAYKIGMTARHVGNCQLAYDYLTVLLERGSNQAKLAEKVGEGRRVLAEIEAEKCATPRQEQPSAPVEPVPLPAVEAEPTPPDPAPEPRPQPPQKPVQATLEEDNPLGLRAPNSSRDRAQQIEDAAGQQRRGMLVTGIILSSVGVLGLGAAAFLHVRTTKTARRLVELSRPGMLTKFPRYDYSCRYVRERNDCPVILNTTYKNYSLATPIAYGVAGGVLAIGAALIIAQRLRVSKLRKKVELTKGRSLQLESISPVWTPQGVSGAAATLRF